MSDLPILRISFFAEFLFFILIVAVFFPENLKRTEKENEDELKKHYETRIKSLTQDLSKQTNSNKTLKIDLDKATDKLKVAEEKLNHTERDIVQKRQLIEFYKKKLDETKISTEKLQNTAEIDELQLKVQNLTDSNEKLKVQTKSLKTRLQVLQDEKTKNDRKYSDNEREIDDLKRELNLMRSQKKQFENELKESKAEVNTLNKTIKDIEYTVEKKLHSLTSSNLQTLDIAQEKLNDAYKRINNFEMILKTFYETVVNRSLRLKKRLNEKKDKKLPAASHNEHNSLKRAMNFASTVLNLSSADLEDIMSNNSAHDESKDEFDDNNKRLGKKLLTEFEALSKSQDSKMAVRLFELLEERLNELIQAEKQYLG
jgi:chromosome segregation ATPase